MRFAPRSAWADAVQHDPAAAISDRARSRIDRMGRRATHHGSKDTSGWPVRNHLTKIAARRDGVRPADHHANDVTVAAGRRGIRYARRHPRARGPTNGRATLGKEVGRALARTLVLGLVLGLTVSLLSLGAAPSGHAETGWVRGEVRLNVRTGPGTQYRIVGVVKTGDEVNVMTRGEDWTKVQITTEDGAKKQGWIPEGYLKPEPPPTVRLAQAESRVAALTKELAGLSGETDKLRSDNQILTGQDGEQQSQIKQLTMENMELRAGARYPEWITGASIFAAGMVLGAWLHRNSARRQPTRIRL